jgi:hypothetical protein
LADVGRLTGRERQSDRIAKRIDDSVNFRAQPAP